MNYSTLMISFIINILITIGIPIGVLAYLSIYRREKVRVFLVGALVFLISQVVLRIPLLNGVLAKMDWFYNMTVFNPILYAVFLGATAGIFEEVGRLVGFNIAGEKNKGWIDGIIFGLGHGGIEAIIFAGIASIQNIYILITLNNGSFNEGFFGVSESTVRSIFDSTTSLMVLYGGIERILATIMHIGFTLIVLYGINKKKKALFLIVAILIHGIVDTTVVISQQAGLSINAIELICGVFASVLLVYIIKSKKKFENFEVNENEKIN